jgi:heavy metal sensor kinase
MWLDLAWQLGSGRDRTLSRRASRCLEFLKAAQDEPPVRKAAKFDEFVEGTPEGNLISVFDERGSLLYPSMLNSGAFPWNALNRDPGDHYSNVQFERRHYRILTRRLMLHGQLIIIRVAGQLEDNRQLLARFEAGLAAATPVLLFLSALCGYFLSRRALEPVDRLTAAVRSITISNVSGRLPIYETGDELQRLAETCNDMLARLQDAVARINRFTADAAHELRNPIAFTRTVTEYALRHHQLDEETRQVFEDILAESQEAGRLLEDMLMLARADAGRLEITLEPLNVAEVLAEVCEKAKARVEAKHQTLTLAGSARVPAWIAGDRSSVRRLFWTLLDNAVKYTPENGRIEVTVTLQEQEVRVRVRDSGIGIPAALLPRVFERFFRVDASRGEADGTGLGLAIAKWIADAHQATLCAESVEGEGTVFEVRFQVLAQHPLASAGARHETLY